MCIIEIVLWILRHLLNEAKDYSAERLWWSLKPYTLVLTTESYDSVDVDIKVLLICPFHCLHLSDFFQSVIPLNFPNVFSPVAELDQDAKRMHLNLSDILLVISSVL